MFRSQECGWKGLRQVDTNGAGGPDVGTSSGRNSRFFGLVLGLVVGEHQAPGAGRHSELRGTFVL